jgi:Holliday junction resolvase
MLTENQVVAAVAAYLIKQGCTIVSCCGTGERGVDIVAEREGKRLLVEAKGRTSAKEWTQRFGKEFSKGQKFDHVGKAFLTAVMVASKGEAQAAIALPDDAGHRELVEAIRPALRTLAITAYLVRPDFSIETI